MENTMTNTTTKTKKRKNFRKKESRLNFVLHIFLGILAVVWILPIIWVVINSLRVDSSGLPAIPVFENIQQTGPLYYLEGLKAIFIPKEIGFDNYINLLTKTDVFNFPRWFMNTLIVAIFTCIISTVIVLATSFAFSRLRFKMRRKFMNIILLLGLFPGFLTMLAIYYILKTFNLDQTLAALILVYSGGASMGYYITKGFFDTIPTSIDESAYLDGATKLQIFTKITLPLAKPIIVYTILTSFLGPWLDFIFSKFIMGTNVDNYTVAVGLFQMLTREFINDYFTQFCAGAVLVAIPIATLFMIMQRFYVGGVTGGSVK